MTGYDYLARGGGSESSSKCRMLLCLNGVRDGPGEELNTFWGAGVSARRQ